MIAYSNVRFFWQAGWQVRSLHQFYFRSLSMRSATAFCQRLLTTKKPARREARLPINYSINGRLHLPPLCGWALMAMAARRNSEAEFQIGICLYRPLVRVGHSARLAGAIVHCRALPPPSTPPHDLLKASCSPLIVDGLNGK